MTVGDGFDGYRGAVPYAMAPVFDNRTRDACVVVPGIMGSVLQDTATGIRLWGVDLSMLTNPLTGKGSPDGRAGSCRCTRRHGAHDVDAWM